MRNEKISFPLQAALSVQLFKQLQRFVCDKKLKLIGPKISPPLLQLSRRARLEKRFVNSKQHEQSRPIKLITVIFHNSAHWFFLHTIMLSLFVNLRLEAERRERKYYATTRCFCKTFHFHARPSRRRSKSGRTETFWYIVFVAINSHEGYMRRSLNHQRHHKKKNFPFCILGVEFALLNKLSSFKRLGTKT